MRKVPKIIGIGAVLLIVFFFGMWIGENENINRQNSVQQTDKAVSETEESNVGNQKNKEEPGTGAVTAGDLMQKNDPNIKRLAFATADYIGKAFTLYAMGEMSDYYNYGFRNELKYYSFRLCDLSTANSSDCVYAYIDKTKPETKAKELFDILLKEPTFIKADVSVPAEKYEQHSNSFLEISKWEVIPLTK